MSRQELPIRSPIAAAGFAEWSSSVTVEPGQDKTLTDIRLRILAAHRVVTVTLFLERSRCPAAQDGRAPARSRFYTKHLCNLRTSPRTSYHADEIPPGVQGSHPPNFLRFRRSGGRESSKPPTRQTIAKAQKDMVLRFGGRTWASGSSEALFGNAILPSLLHQDPRYFYHGSGTKGSRAWHAIHSSICLSGRQREIAAELFPMGWQFDFSFAFPIPTTQVRIAELGFVFRTFGTNMGLHVVLGLAQEFLLGKFTSKGRH